MVEPPRHKARRAEARRVQILHEQQVVPCPVYSFAQVGLPSQAHSMTGLLHELPRFVKMEPFTETLGLSQCRADLAAQLGASLRPLLE
jgi:hypothetical protein